MHLRRTQAEERGSIKHQPAEPTATLPFPDALLQVGWVVQVRCQWGAGQVAALRCDSSSRPAPALSHLCAWRCVPPDLLAAQAARDPEVQVPPLKVPLLYGLACSIHFLLPAGALQAWPASAVVLA